MSEVLKFKDIMSSENGGSRKGLTPYLNIHRLGKM